MTNPTGGVRMGKVEYECERCRIPKNCYNLKIEPGLANPDFTMPKDCQYGHFWVLKLAKESEGGKR